MSTPATDRPRRDLSRRSLLAAAGTLAAGLSSTGVARGHTPTESAPRRRQDYPLTWFGGFDRRRYLTYPHANGFLRGGDYVTYAELHPETATVQIWARRLRTDAGAVLLVEFPADPAAATGRHRFVYWDVHLTTGVMTVVCRDQVFRVDTNAALRRRSAAVPELIYPGNGTNIPGMTSIHPDGGSVVFGHITGPRVDPDDPMGFLSRIVEIDLATGGTSVLLEVPFGTTHVHYLPHDPNWIMFNHEGEVGSHHDRAWGYHATEAPAGRIIGPHLRADGSMLHLNHERGAFASPTFGVIQYANSTTDPDNPRGLYEGHVDGRPLRPVAGGVYQHCDLSRDGRWAVCDAGIGGEWWLELVDMTGEQAPVVIVDGIMNGSAHPAHLHPVFSPDGRYVLFNDADPLDPVAGGVRIGMVQVA